MPFLVTQILCLGFFGVCKAQKVDKCALLNALLSVERVNKDLKLEERPNKTIRFIDVSRSFKGSTCNYKTSLVGVVSKIPLDLNTGRCIDICILNYSKLKDLISFEIFYTLSGQNDKNPNLLKGTITFLLTMNGIETKDVKIYSIQ